MTRRHNEPPSTAGQHPEPTDAQPPTGMDGQVDAAAGGDSPPGGESRYRPRRTPAPDPVRAPHPSMIGEPDACQTEHIHPNADPQAIEIGGVNEGLTVFAPVTPPVIAPAAARALLRILLAARTREPDAPDVITSNQPPENTKT